MASRRRPWCTVNWPVGRWYFCRATALAHHPPHGVNYRANIWALKQTGATRVIAVNAVGGITSGYLSSERLVLPDQIIDYTYDRKHTFFGNDLQQVTHIDFTEPYCVELRRLLIEAAKLAKLPLCRSRYLWRHSGSALRECGRDPAHGARRCRHRRHDGHARGRSRA